MLQERGLIPISTIAQKVGYSVESIRRYIKKNKLKGDKYGATLYFHKEIVENIIRVKQIQGKIS